MTQQQPNWQRSHPTQQQPKWLPALRSSKQCQTARRKGISFQATYDACTLHIQQIVIIDSVQTLSDRITLT
jgi:hypothetical protein